MRVEFRSSRARNYLRSPKTCGLFEHEYGIELTEDRWKEVARNVETCLTNFYASDTYQTLKLLSKQDWLEIEEFSSFRLDNIRINLVIDCAIREGEDVHIYDWKTGRSLSEDLSVQLSCYALYAMEKRKISPERLHITEYNLSVNKANWFVIGSDQVEDTKGYIRGSIKDMQSLLLDLQENIPMEEDRFTKVENERASGRCNFRKLCRR